MIVVADTSPLNYLILIGKIELVPNLLGQVIIPKAVFDELQAKETPLVVQMYLGISRTGLKPEKHSSC